MTVSTHRTRRRLVATLATAALVAAACGGGDDDGDESTDEPAPAETADDEPADEPTEPVDEPADEPTEESADEPTEEPPVGVEGEEIDGTQVDTGEDESDGSGSVAPVGDTVRIGLLNQENDPIGSFPEFRLGVEGAAEYINSELDGIGGRPVEIVSCVHNSVEAAQNCAQELATSDIVSLINGVNIWTFAFDFYGTMGSTPIIGGLPLFPADYDQPNARYFNGGSISIYAAMARFAAEELQVGKVAVLLNQNPAATAALEQGLQPIFDQFGVEYSVIDVPLPLTDAIPPVSQAAAADADLVMLLAAADECVPIIRARDQLGIAAETMIYSATCADEDVYNEVGDLLVGSWMHRPAYFDVDPWAPAEVRDLIAENENQIATYAPDAPDAAFTGLGFTTLLEVHDLYEEIGPDNLSPDAIFAAADDGSTRVRTGGFGWSCIYADAGLQSVCQGDNLFVQIEGADGTSSPPPNDGAFVNGLELLG